MGDQYFYNQNKTHPVVVSLYASTRFHAAMLQALTDIICFGV